MTTEKIISILDKWNFWNQKIETGFERKEYLLKMDRYLKMPEIIAVTGVRRSGKSTIILQLIERLIQKGVNPCNTLYINFEEPGFGNFLDSKLLSEIFEAYLEFYDPQGQVYLFFDEVQLVPGWEKFVASLYDRREKVKIFVTGSSSKLLMGEISTLLSGRYVSEIIYPLSFREFLDFKKINYSPLIASPKIYKALREYLEFGGFPRVVTEKEIFNKKVLLAEYFNSILERDILLRHSIRGGRDVREIVNFIYSNVSKLVSTYRIEKDFGISSQNSGRYFEYFKESFLIQFLPYFSFSVKKQMRNPQKVFAIDTGLSNAVSFKFSEDVGKLLENIVSTEFLRRKKQLYYWKNKREIDFVLRTGHDVSELVNVTYFLNGKSVDREIKSLEEGLERFPGSKATLIYWKTDSVPKHKNIKFKNILDFLLERESSNF